MPGFCIESVGGTNETFDNVNAGVDRIEEESMDERERIRLESYNLGLAVGRAGGDPLQVLRGVVEGERTFVESVADLRSKWGSAIPDGVYQQLAAKHPELIENGRRLAAQVLKGLGAL